ncbi:MAG: DegQ family serine endoprotease [Chthoniobacteraceae bacterium]
MKSLGKISTLSLCLLSAPLLTPSSVFAEAPSNNPAPQPVMSFAPTVDKVGPSVVTVYMSKTVKGMDPSQMFGGNPFLRQFLGNGGGMPRQQRQQKEQGLGSGIIVSADGYILTNNHVVDGADEINVQLGDDSKSYKAKLIGTDRGTDLALIKIDAKGLTPIQFTDSDKVKVGDVVLAVGAPLGLAHTVTMGIVSALGRNGLQADGGASVYQDFIQTDAAINPGNSGGPLVDANGRLIGINSMIQSLSGGNEGVGFAIPANLASLVMTQLKDHGKVTRGYIGIGLQPITSDLAAYLKLDTQNGALVNEVQSGTPGDKAGLQRGDVIVKLNGAEVKDASRLQLAVGEMSPGTKVTLSILRDGQAKEVGLTLGEKPDKDVADNNSPSEMDHSNALDGITVDDITPEARDRFNIGDDVKGALITDIDENSAGADAGLQVGDVIVEIDRQPVKSADQAIKLSDSVKKGQKTLLRVITHGVSRYVAVSDKND